jgi:hypothetical protein
VHTLQNLEGKIAWEPELDLVDVLLSLFPRWLNKPVWRPFRAVLAGLSLKPLEWVTPMSMELKKPRRCWNAAPPDFFRVRKVDRARQAHETADIEAAVTAELQRDGSVVAFEMKCGAVIADRVLAIE